MKKIISVVCLLLTLVIILSGCENNSLGTGIGGNGNLTQTETVNVPTFEEVCQAFKDASYNIVIGSATEKILGNTTPDDFTSKNSGVENTQAFSGMFFNMDDSLRCSSSQMDVVYIECENNTQAKYVYENLSQKCENAQNNMTEKVGNNSSSLTCCNNKGMDGRSYIGNIETLCWVNNVVIYTFEDWRSSITENYQNSLDIVINLGVIINETQSTSQPEYNTFSSTETNSSYGNVNTTQTVTAYDIVKAFENAGYDVEYRVYDPEVENCISCYEIGGERIKFITAADYDISDYIDIRYYTFDDEQSAKNFFDECRKECPENAYNVEQIDSDCYKYNEKDYASRIFYYKKGKTCILFGTDWDDYTDSKKVPFDHKPEEIMESLGFKTK